MNTLTRGFEDSIPSIFRLENNESIQESGKINTHRDIAIRN